MDPAFLIALNINRWSVYTAYNSIFFENLIPNTFSLKLCWNSPVLSNETKNLMPGIRLKLPCLQLQECLKGLASYGFCPSPPLSLCLPEQALLKLPLPGK